MYNQDGQVVDPKLRDEQLIVEHGTWRRGQKATDEELSERVPKGDYSQQQPVTMWTHQLDRKNFQCSAGVGANPFARTSGFTQTADQTKSVSGYYGNIDFEQESARNSFRKSHGTTLKSGNPYIGTDVAISSLNTIADRIIAVCKAKSPGLGLRALTVALRSITHDGLVDPIDFKYALRTFGIELSEDEAAALIKSFDLGKSGKFSLNELMYIIRTPGWNA